MAFPETGLILYGSEREQERYIRTAPVRHGIRMDRIPVSVVYPYLILCIRSDWIISYSVLQSAMMERIFPAVGFMVSASFSMYKS